MTMKIRVLVALTICFLALPVVYGQTSCPSPAAAMGDGRVKDFDFVPNSGANFYQFRAQAGRSYSIELLQPYDPRNASVGLFIYPPTDPTCASALTGASLRDTSAVEPSMEGANNSGIRYSLISATAGIYKIGVFNTDATLGKYISISISDTTMFGPRFSSSGYNSANQTGFHTEWGFLNTTSSVCNVIFSLIDSNGNPVTTAIGATPQAIPAKGVLFLDTRTISAGVALNVAPNLAGTATLQSDCPPGGIIADAQIINAGFSNGTFIQPGIFAAARQNTH